MCIRDREETVQSSLQTRHIDEVIASAARDGMLAEANSADGVIRRSWVRCVNDHGLDPTRAQPARIVENACLREHQEQIEGFLRVARGGMEQLFKRVSPLGYAVSYTHLRAHETVLDLVCRLLLEKKNAYTPVMLCGMKLYTTETTSPRR